MNINHIVAVFKAEYYTTTAKFRSMRKYIPFVFLGGIVAFSYLLRVIYDLFRGNLIVTTPSIPTFFSIIAIFSYFTLFAPLLSPIGRVVYDGSAKSRREVALNAPVKAEDLLYGNLLSNLAFFLPFFGFVGTLTLAPFIGNGVLSPLITALALFGILSLLILIGLLAGTLISPLIFHFISSQKNSQIRAIVTFSVSAMLVFSLPILRYFLENVTLSSNLGWIAYLPFTLAAILIIFVLYGVTISVPAHTALIGLIVYVVVIFIIGYFSANIVYNLDGDNSNLNTSNPDGIAETILKYLTSPIPKSYTTVTRATMKASLRDIEHLARLTIGISISIFMIFALSSQGLFRSSANFDQTTELAVVVFALVLSSASVIFIESSSFTIQHRDMLSLIKSAPDGSKKFVVGKAIQMILLLVPVFVSLIVALAGFGFISVGNLIPLSLIILFVLIMMTTLSLMIHLINPTDNEEDLGNLVNLLVFYLLSFIIAIIPVYSIIAEVQFSRPIIVIGIFGILGISLFFLYIAIKALESMNLETLNSPMSLTIIHGTKTFGLFILTWNILPLFALSYLLETQDEVGFVIGVYGIILTSVIYYFYRQKGIIITGRITEKNLVQLSKYLAIMIIIGGVSASLQSIFNANLSVLSVYILLPTQQWIIALLILAIVAIEELYFRGMILHYSRKKLSDNYAIILNAAIFAVFHFFTLITLINSFIQGFILAKLKIRTRSVIYPLLAHAIYNMLFLGILFFY